MSEISPFTRRKQNIKGIINIIAIIYFRFCPTCSVGSRLLPWPRPCLQVSTYYIKKKIIIMSKKTKAMYSKQLASRSENCFCFLNIETLQNLFVLKRNCQLHNENEIEIKAQLKLSIQYQKNKLLPLVMSLFQNIYRR